MTSCVIPVRVESSHEVSEEKGISYALNQPNSEHARILCEDAGMMSVLMERMDDMETAIRRGFAQKRRADFG